MRTAEPAPRPNIVFILADDLGWNDVGYHGSPIRTPNLDRLAREGVRLHQHYVQPTCSPTRVALLTGRNPARFNVFAPLEATSDVRPRDMHLPVALQALGYTTHITGKWHIGETPASRPLKYGFTTSYGYLRGQIDPYTHRYKFGDHVTWHRNDAFVEEDGHVTRLITDEAVRVIASASDRPFFLYIAHHAPHHPLNEPPAWIDPYQQIFRDPSRRHYAGSVSHLDHEVGRVVAALDRTSRRDNTLIIFSSDNGGQASWPAAAAHEYNNRYAPLPTLGSNTPLRGWKTEVYEGGIRVPAFVNWPARLAGGREVDVPVHVFDWAPTLIALAGGRVDPARLEGRDLWALLTGTSTSPPARRFYWNHANQMWAARDGDWKLVVSASGEVELLDLASDPLERTNLRDRHPHRVARMRALLAAERARDGAAVTEP